jgi:hypothetical protein
MKGEKLLTMRQAAEFLEAEFGIRRRPSTVWAWGYYGSSRGGKLEMVSINGQWHTSAEALRRFFTNCTRGHGQRIDVNALHVG